MASLDANDVSRDSVRVDAGPVCRRTASSGPECVCANGIDRAGRFADAATSEIHVVSDHFAEASADGVPLSERRHER
ncbi:hypothetical protein [Burkholderia plantarii]|nr:hypothetical protein [Burkholderia plantarii]WLE59150.1 hypothetical protein GIY62_00075 [Burkholderia plantarii]